jgi:hypothetical protein
MTIKNDKINSKRKKQKYAFARYMSYGGAARMGIRQRGAFKKYIAITHFAYTDTRGSAE